MKHVDSKSLSVHIDDILLEQREGRHEDAPVVASEDHGKTQTHNRKEDERCEIESIGSISCISNNMSNIASRSLF